MLCTIIIIKHELVFEGWKLLIIPPLFSKMPTKSSYLQHLKNEHYEFNFDQSER